MEKKDVCTAECCAGGRRPPAHSSSDTCPYTQCRWWHAVQLQTKAVSSTAPGHDSPVPDASVHTCGLRIAPASCAAPRAGKAFVLCGAAAYDLKLADIGSSLLCLRSVQAESQSANRRGLVREPPWFAVSDRQRLNHNPARNVSIMQLPSTRCQTMFALRCAPQLWSVDFKRPPSNPRPQ